MHLDILTPDRSLFSGEVESVTVPGSKGRFQILKMHAALVSSLEKGKVNVKTEGREEVIEISGGVIEVLNDKVVILA